MDIYSWWPYIVIMILTFAIFNLPIFSYIDEPIRPGAVHVGGIDGLRGILALSVVFHHFAINYNYQINKVWEFPISKFYSLCGPVSVALFFMITGFLFSEKMFSEKSISWKNLYIGRFFRIAPMYTVAVLAMFFVVACMTKFSLDVPLGKLLAQIGAWLMVGIPSLYPDVNGLKDTKLILAGVTWTIHYEWLFYFSLPLLRIFRKSKKIFSVCLLIPLLLIQLSNFAHVTSLLVFSCGIFCQAWAPRNFKYAKYSTILSVVACAAIFVVYAVGGSGNSGLSILFMLIFFMSITSGASIFGFLISKGARRVGAISYGIYILQGIPLWIIFSNSSIKNWSMMSSVHYWIICAASVAILLFFAFLGHFLIEKPFIGFGKKLGSGSPEHKLDGLKVSRFSSK